VQVLGPPGLTYAVETKLRAHTWNLLDERSRDFAIVASDWADEGIVAEAVLRARNAFRHEARNASAPSYDPEFTVETITLDHGIPCLAFAFQEKIRVNVHKATLRSPGRQMWNPLIRCTSHRDISAGHCNQFSHRFHDR